MTLADGTYTIEVAAKATGTVKVSASKKGMTFVPAEIGVPAHAGSAVTGIDFTGFVNATISGVVVAALGGPQAGAVVTATSVPDSAVVVVDTTGVTGAFSLNVPFGTYTMDATLKDHTFGWPATGQVVGAAPGQQVNFGKVQAKTFAPTAWWREAVVCGGQSRHHRRRIQTHALLRQRKGGVVRGHGAQRS